LICECIKGYFLKVRKTPKKQKKTPNLLNSYDEIQHRLLYNTVKGARGKVSFDSQNDKYASQLSCDASSEAYLKLRVAVKHICHLVNKM
jgi:hypothetical protein